MKWINKITAIGLICIFISVLIFYACQKEEEITQPEIPPESTFVMDFSNFQNTQKTNANWGFSVLNVAFWNTVLTVALVVPVTSFKTALAQKPEKLANNKWTWTFNFTILNVVYSAKLTGTVENKQILWEMKLSKTGGFTDFVWYTGSSDLAGTAGTWILMSNPVDNVKFLQIDWTRNTTDQTGVVKYTYIKPNDPQNGMYIEWKLTKENPFNANYTIFNKQKQNTTYIRWNTTDKSGSVKDLLQFGDSNWHCWNNLLADITCTTTTK